MSKDEDKLSATGNGFSSSESSRSTHDTHGVVVRNAVKSYGVGKGRSTILKGLDMNVMKGSM